MTVHVTIVCDHPDCRQFVTMPAPIVIAKARQFAHREWQWKLDDKKDFCPQHAFETPRLEVRRTDGTIVPTDQTSEERPDGTSFHTASWIE